jgi:hypothetical protein
VSVRKCRVVTTNAPAVLARGERGEGKSGARVVPGRGPGLAIQHIWAGACSMSEMADRPIGNPPYKLRAARRRRAFGSGFLLRSKRVFPGIEDRDVGSQECRVSLVNPSGGSCRRTDSLLGDSLCRPGTPRSGGGFATSSLRRSCSGFATPFANNGMVRPASPNPSVAGTLTG